MKLKGYKMNLYVAYAKFIDEGPVVLAVNISTGKLIDYINEKFNTEFKDEKKERYLFSNIGDIKEIYIEPTDGDIVALMVKLQREYLESTNGGCNYDSVGSNCIIS